MDPSDPLDAQQIVVEYARILERDLEQHRHPGRLDTLPYAKPIIKDAIRTSVKNLAASGRLSDDLREYLETAYTSLADYLDPELADLLIKYRKSADRLAAEPHASHEKTKSPAWRTLVEGGALAGEVARATTREADELREEFRGLLSSA